MLYHDKKSIFCHFNFDGIERGVYIIIKIIIILMGLIEVSTWFWWTKKGVNRTKKGVNIIIRIIIVLMGLIEVPIW